MLALAVSVAVAQEGPSPADLRRMYDDAVAQLRAAQDRRAELANENEKLKARLAEQDKRLKLLEARTAELEAQHDTFAERTYQLRASQSAWAAFLRTRPETRGQWEAYLKGGGDVPTVDDATLASGLPGSHWILPR